MSIAVTGPEKFAFQDLACLELALALRAFGDFTFIPEPTGGEDSSFVWTGATPVTLEVQVKGAAGTAGVTQLLDFLVHFPAHQAVRPLLERLMDEDGTHVRFILTARAADALVPLLTAATPAGLPTARPVPSGLAADLRTALATVAKGKPTKKKQTALKQARSKALAVVAARPIADFERALAKVHIVDQQSAESVEVRLHTQLTLERFDQLTLRSAIGNLTDLLAIAKRDQTDAIGPIRKRIEELAPHSLLPVGYQERGIEAALQTHLLSNHVLLLAGPPRAGKSWTALAVAGRLQKAGYEVRTGDSVEEAERFLADAGGPRIYVLDDPLGGREPVARASTALAALAALCQHLPGHRRLIVAQAESVLFQVRGNSTLTACSLGRYHWQRLEPLTLGIAQSVWRTAAVAQGLAATDIERVASLIDANPLLREPGALTFLAQTFGELSKNPADAEILFQARKDATDFARSLAARSQSLHDVLVACALSTTPSHDVENAQLAFVINGQGEPGLESDWVAFSMGGNDDAEPPSYETTPVLDGEQITALLDLQRRRVLGLAPDGLNFLHAYLRAGAQSLLTPDIPHDTAATLAGLRRVIGCPSPVTSLAGARNLSWLRSPLRSVRDAVMQIAVDGVRSIFPATRDVCFQFLIDYSDELPADLAKRIPGLAENTVVSFERLAIAQGMAFLANSYDFVSPQATIQSVRPYLDAIDQGQPLGLDLPLSRKILGALEGHEDIMTLRMIGRFLLADEAVVRAAAARLWLARNREGDADVLARLALDRVPAVSVALFKALVYQWDGLSAARRDSLMAVLAMHAQSPSSASVLFSRMVKINRREEYVNNPPWAVLTTLMPVVIDHLPLSIDFNNGRLNAVIDDAIEALPPNAVTPILQAWGRRLIKKIGKGVLGEYELSVVDPLLVGATAEARLPITRSLMETTDTGARVVTVRWLTNGWDQLDTGERDYLRDSLVRADVDQRWLVATMLTGPSPAPALLRALGLEEDVLSLGVGELEQRLGAPFFDACVQTFIGSPQPLWWYACHHRSEHWRRIVDEIAADPTHRLHAVAFIDFAQLRPTSALETLVAAIPDEYLFTTFELMLGLKVASSADWKRSAWVRMLERLEALGRLGECVERIDRVLDGILDDMGDLLHWLGNGPLVNRVAQRLPNDWNALSKLRTIRTVYQEMTSPDDGADSVDVAPVLWETLMASLLKTALDSPPRLHGTWAQLRSEAKSMGASQACLASFEEQRELALKRHQDIRWEARDPDQALPSWIDLAAQNASGAVTH